MAGEKRIVADPNWESVKRWRQANPERYRRYMREYMRKKRARG